jgi:hypothetical protein
LVALFNFTGVPSSFFGKRTDSVNHLALNIIFDKMMKSQDWDITQIIDDDGLAHSSKKLMAYKLVIMTKCQDVYMEVRHSKFCQKSLELALPTLLP